MMDPSTSPATFVSAPPWRPPLVKCVVARVAPQLSGLPHIVAIISQCLDISGHISLKNAAASGSLRLLDRVAHRVLHGLVPLDPALRAQWLAQAMEAAIQKNDLMMVQKIHALHPDRLVWIIEHRHDRLCCDAGAHNLCISCLDLALRTIGKQDTFRVIQWLVLQGFALPLVMDITTSFSMARAAQHSLDLVRWLLETDRLSSSACERLLEAAICRFPSAAESLELVQFLIANGTRLAEDRLRVALIHGACQRGTQAVIEYVLASPLCDVLRSHVVYDVYNVGAPQSQILQLKVLQWSQAYMDANDEDVHGVIILAVNYYAHFETMRWLAMERGVTNFQLDGMPFDSDSSELREQHLLELYAWLHASGVGVFSDADMDNAACFGLLQLVQWLHEHRTEGCSTRAMDWAAAGGHLHVIRWLHANRTEGCTADAMSYAAASGHVEIVQWLHENRTEAHTTAAMASAAVEGQVEMLTWLDEHRGDGCTTCALRAVVQSPHDITSRGDPESLPVLNSLRWLRTHPSPPSVNCQGRCLEPPSDLYDNLVNQAIVNGDLAVLEFIYEHVGAEFHQQLIHSLLHLPVLQWLYKYHPLTITWEDVYWEARKTACLDIVAWLDTVDLIVPHEYHVIRSE